MPHNFSSSRTQSHSNELEHRVTKAESLVERLAEIHDELREDHERVAESHTAKLSLHEKAILGIAGVLYILAQDKFPMIAAIIKGFRP